VFQKQAPGKDLENLTDLPAATYLRTWRKSVNTRTLTRRFNCGYHEIKQHETTLHQPHQQPTIVDDSALG
jgi:hypothetical protein